MDWPTGIPIMVRGLPVGSEFGWMARFVAALSAGIFTLIFVFIAVQCFFPLSSEEKERISNAASPAEIKVSKPLSQTEWITLITLTLTIAGWLSMPMHGINEAWVALAALLIFHITGVINKETFTRKLDWGLILFFGIVNSMAEVTNHLKVDHWFIAQLQPALSYYSLGPLPS